MEGLGNTYGFAMARKEPEANWLVRVLYYMSCYDELFQAQPAVMALPDPHEWRHSDDEGDAGASMHD